MERDIVILTDGLTGGRGKAGGETLWTIRPTAVAWLPVERAADPDAVPGPEGRIWRQDEDDVLDALQAKIHDNAVLRVRVQDGVDEPPREGTQNLGDGTEPGWHWRLVDVLDPVPAPALERLRAERLTVVTAQHPVLGELSLNRDFGQYEGFIAWPGADEDGLRLSVGAGTDEENTAAFEAVAALVANAAALDRAARERIADDYLELKNNEWQDDDGRQYTRDEFMAALRAATLSLEDPDSEDWTLWFDDGDLFFGHGFTVDFTGDTPTDSCLVG